MVMKNSKSESAPRFSKQAVASAPITRPQLPAPAKLTRPQSCKDFYAYDYFQIGDHTDPVKIMVPDLMENKQNRLQTGRRHRRAITAGFSRRHVIAETPNCRVMAWEQESFNKSDKNIEAIEVGSAQLSTDKEERMRFSGLSSGRSSENATMKDSISRHPPHISFSLADDSINSIIAQRLPRRRSSASRKMSFNKLPIANEFLGVSEPIEDRERLSGIFNPSNQ
jgi:hypothetical protein